MGNQTSVELPPVNDDFATMCVSYQGDHYISILHHDDEVLSTIRKAIVEAWPNGIKDELAVCGSGWKLNIEGSYNLTFY